MLLGILLVLFFLLLLYILWVPIVVCVDTVKNQYYVSVKGLAMASIVAHKEELVQIKLKIIFFKFYFFPIRKLTAPKKKKARKKQSRKRKSTRMSSSTLLRILKSFRVKKFFINLDTGDCITNAKLYPAFAFLDYTLGGFNINFDGKNEMVLYLNNRPFYILRSIINL